jgi:hypothetical protein
VLRAVFLWTISANKKGPGFLRGQLLLRDLVADLLPLKDHAAILGHCPL